MNESDPFDADRWPKLTFSERTISLIAGVASWFIVQRSRIPCDRSPAMFRSSCSLASGSAGVGTYLLSSWIFFNIEYTKRLRKPETLADAGSRFVRIDGTNVRWKESRTESPSSVERAARSCLILLHGFGASLFTFRYVMDQIATRTYSNVRAFDLPAFGLTQRSFDRHLYSLESMARISAQFAAMSQQSGQETYILGHSMGALVALMMTMRSQHKVGALILVSPAISFLERKAAKKNSIAHRIRAILLPLRYVLATAQTTFRLVAAQFVRVLSPVFRGLLRLVVGQKRLWQYGLTLAVKDPDKVRESTLRGYRLPDRVIGWDRALLTFLINRFQGFLSVGEFFSEIHGLVHGKAVEDYSRMLEDLKKSSLPVLIIHGADDRIVPVGNSKQLAEYLGCELVIIEECGHIPQEEKPDQFVECIARFLTHSSAESRSMQPVGLSAP